MTVLSFDFSNVTTNSGPNIGDIPLDVALYATVDDVEVGTFNGVDKFVLKQTIYIDPADDSKTVQFSSFIGPKHGWLLAQYLEAVGQDFRSLSGQGISAESLKSVLVGEPLNVTFKSSNYEKNGEKKTSKQITTVRSGQ